MKTLKIILAILVAVAIACSIALLTGCKPKTPPINYQSQLDSLNGVISLQDQIIDNMVADLDSLIDVKSKVQYLHGAKIIEYRTLNTPAKVAKFAERL
jgi:hypothetical protein